MLNIPEYDMAEFKGQIVDTIEDFLNEKGITIMNSERDEYNKEAGYGPGENDVALFGTDYDSIADEAEGLVKDGNENLIAWNSIITLDWILKARGSRTITEDEKEQVRMKINKVIACWGEDYGIINYSDLNKKINSEPDTVTLEDLARMAYEKYIYDWLLNHNMSFLMLINKITTEKDIVINELTFDGMSFVCFEEFKQCEFNDEGYMQELLTTQQYNIYCKLMDIEQ